MVGIEHPWSLRCVHLVVFDTRVPEDKGVDVQVEWGMTGGILRG